jgi:hypothetical protein
MAPICLCFENVELVGQCSPDVPKRREARHDVPQVGIVTALVHAGGSPLVVGMEQNDIGFDSEGLEIADARFVAGEELRIEAV